MSSVAKTCLYHQPLMPIKSEQSSAPKEGTKGLAPYVHFATAAPSEGESVHSLAAGAGLRQFGSYSLRRFLRDECLFALKYVLFYEYYYSIIVFWCHYSIGVPLTTAHI